MASTYVNNLRLNEMATGDASGTWGTTTNTNLELIGEAFGYGTRAIADASTDTITMGDGVSDADRSMYLKLTGGGQACTVSLLPNTASKVWIMENATSYTLTFTCGTGANVAILAGEIKMIATDGAGSGGAVLDVLTDVNLAGTTKVVALTASGAITGSSTIQGTTITATTAFVPDASDGAALGTSLLEFSDLFLADGAVVSFGDDDDVTLTHVVDTGLLLSSTDQLQFGDAGSVIYQSGDGILRMNGEVTIDMYASGSVLVSNDLQLNSDASVLGFGVNNDVTLTHVHDTGLLLNDAMALQFHDASQYINAPSATVLDINATDEIELNATAVDLNGTLDVSGTSTLTGNVTMAGDLAVDGTANLDEVDIDGAVQIDSTVTVGLDDTGYDVKFFGATASAYMLWDESEDDLILAGAAGLNVDGTTDLDNTDINGTLVVDGSNISLDSTSTLNIDNSNTSNGITVGTATSGVPVSIGHTTSEVTVNDNLTVTGTLTLGSGAELTEAELEMLDGITAGTVTASKAVVVDSNKDISTFRNLTIDGVFTDGNYTFDTSGNVSGLGTVGSGAITSSGVVAGTGFTIGSAVINEAELETIDGVTAGTVSASKAVVVDGNKDIASFRNVTLTGELDAGSLDVEGDADINGTLETDALSINGTPVSSTATELNILDGATVVVGEINYLDLGSTAVGTAIASKAVVLDSNKDYTGIRNLTITGELDAATLDISGAIDVEGTANLDVVDIDGAVDMASTLAVAGVLTGASLDISGNIDIDGTSNLDVVDIDGAVDMASTLTLAGNADFNGDLDVDGTTNLDVVDIDGAVDMATTLAVAGNVDFNGDLDVDGTTNLDAVDIDGNVNLAGYLDVYNTIYGTRADNSAGLQLKCTDSDANAGPLILLDRDTDSPADGDTLGRIYAQGRNDADELITYTQFTSKCNDVTDGTEDGEMLINVMTNGTATSVMSITGAEIQTDATLVDLNGALDVSGTSTLTGAVTTGADLTIPATNKIYLDGGGNSYIHENSADSVQVVAGGTASFFVSDAGIGVPATSKIWLDNGGNTYIRESSGDTICFTTEGSDNFKFASDGGNPSIQILGNAGGATATVEYSEGGEFFWQHGVRGSDEKWYLTGNATLHTDYALMIDSRDVAVGGALSKGSGSFKIDHPLPSMKDTHDLYHSFIEGPRADLIYRGQIDLVGGQATVEMDAEFGMTAGTWELLCRDATCFTTNETGWHMVKGSVSGSTLTIECQESDCTDTVSWLVVAERQDQHMYDTEWTDSNGRPILEREKPEEVEDL